MKIFLISLAVFLSMTASAVTHMRVEKTDGTVIRYEVDAVSQVRFEEFCPMTDSVSVCGNVGKYDYVDLGLPSGLKWATLNIGAKTVTDYGSYFAWGETKPKQSFSWDNYSLCMGSDSTLTKYCLNSYFGKIDNKQTLESADDAAHVIWGDTWRLPSSNEVIELIDGCNWRWTDNFSNSGVSGFVGTSKKNYTVIFFPAAGFYCGDQIIDKGKNAYCWASSLYIEIYKTGEHGNILDLEQKKLLISRRTNGLTIRPVTK